MMPHTQCDRFSAYIEHPYLDDDQSEHYYDHGEDAYDIHEEHKYEHAKQSHNT